MEVRSEAYPPTYRIEFTEDGRALVESSAPAVHLDSSYLVEDTAITRAFGSRLQPDLADLIDIALAVYVADRLSRRRPCHANRTGLHWTRQFDLTIPVRSPERWRDGQLYQQFHKLLWFLTEDDWCIHFIQRNGGNHVSELAQTLFPMPPTPPVTTALFSGGLDSLAGLYCELAGRPEGSIVLLSVSTNERIREKQRALARRVRDRSGRDIIPVNVPVTLRRGGRRYHDDERTQRSRGFLFGVLGAVAALVAGANSLAVYENGIGAINLPYTPGQLGTHSTRSAHPSFLEGLGVLISLATNREFTFRIPFLCTTKAELCAMAARQGLGADIRETVSCDSFPLRIPDKPQCGVCTSCLLRRQALYASGLQQFDAEEQYRFDVVSSDHAVPYERLRSLRVMLAQVEMLHQSLEHVDDWHSLVQRYPQLWEVEVNLQSLGQKEATVVQQGLTGLYRRYCDEWTRFPVASAHANSAAGAVN